MCSYLGYEVVALKRIRIINISLDVPLGRFRNLTENEILELNQLIEPSSKTEDASFEKTVIQKNFKRPTSFKPKNNLIQKKSNQ